MCGPSRICSQQPGICYSTTFIYIDLIKSQNLSQAVGFILAENLNWLHAAVSAKTIPFKSPVTESPTLFFALVYSAWTARCALIRRWQARRKKRPALFLFLFNSTFEEKIDFSIGESKRAPRISLLRGQWGSAIRFITFHDHQRWRCQTTKKWDQTTFFSHQQNCRISTEK